MNFLVLSLSFTWLGRYSIIRRNGILEWLTDVFWEVSMKMQKPHTSHPRSITRMPKQGFLILSMKLVQIKFDIGNFNLSLINSFQVMSLPLHNILVLTQFPLKLASLNTVIQNTKLFLNLCERTTLKMLILSMLRRLKKWSLVMQQTKVSMLIFLCV